MTPWKSPSTSLLPMEFNSKSVSGLIDIVPFTLYRAGNGMMILYRYQWCTHVDKLIYINNDYAQRYPVVEKFINRSYANDLSIVNFSFSLSHTEPSDSNPTRNRLSVVSPCFKVERPQIPHSGLTYFR